MTNISLTAFAGLTLLLPMTVAAQARPTSIDTPLGLERVARPHIGNYNGKGFNTGFNSTRAILEGWSSGQGAGQYGGNPNGN